MASKIPRVASSARQILAQSARTPSTRIVHPARPAVCTHIQRRYASGKPHYDPAPSQIESILKENEAEPESAEEWKEIGISALRNCSSQAERDAVQEYITNAVKPKLTEEEVIAVASQVGVHLTTPEHLVAAQAVVKNIMKAATLSEAELLFRYYEQTGEFPAEIKSALKESLTKAISTPEATTLHHDHHDDHEHGHGHASTSSHSDAKEGFGVGWYLALGAIPFSYILFLLTEGKDTDDNKPYLTRLMHKYDSWQEEWRSRNELHTKLVEQAGYDRLLFRHAATSDGRGTGKKDVRFEDAINQGPPINVTPGSYANVDKVIEHYKKLNEETEEKRLAIEKFYVEKARAEGRL